MGEFFPLQEERTIDTDPIQTQPQPQMNPKSCWGRFFGSGRRLPEERLRR